MKRKIVSNRVGSRFISILLVILTIAAFPMYAFANVGESVSRPQDERERIMELQSLLGSAYRNNDAELVAAYESELRELGLQIMDPDEASGKVQSMTGEYVASPQIESPGELTHTRWTLEEINGYRYLSQFYDISILTCIPKDSNGGAWLYDDGDVWNNHDLIIKTGTVMTELLGIFVENSAVGIIYTFAQILDFLDIDMGYEEYELSCQDRDITCSYHAYSTISFYYVKPSGEPEDEYRLTTVENSIEMNYAYLMDVTIVTDGLERIVSVPQDDISSTVGVIFQDQNHGGLDRVCNNYEEPGLLHAIIYSAGDYIFKFGDEEVHKPSMQVPQQPSYVMI